MVSSLEPDFVFLTHDEANQQHIDALKSMEKAPIHIFSNIKGESKLNQSKLQKPFSSEQIVSKLSGLHYGLLQKEMFSKLESLLTRKEIPLKKLRLRTTEGFELVNHDDITHIQADRAYCIINLRSKRQIYISKPLSTLLKELGQADFFRAHRSYVINLSLLESFKNVDGGYAVMVNDICVPVSRRQKKELVGVMRKFGQRWQ